MSDTDQIRRPPFPLHGIQENRPASVFHSFRPRVGSRGIDQTTDDGETEQARAEAAKRAPAAVL